MSTDRQALIVKLREREQDLRAACEYVGGGVKGVIFAEVAENTRDAADALEQAETELSSLREAAREAVNAPMCSFTVSDYHNDDVQHPCAAEATCWVWATDGTWRLACRDHADHYSMERTKRLLAFPVHPRLATLLDPSPSDPEETGMVGPNGVRICGAVFRSHGEDFTCNHVPGHDGSHARLSWPKPPADRKD